MMKTIINLQKDFNIGTMEMYRIPGYTKKVLDWIVPIKSKAKQNKTKTPNQKK